MKKCFLIIVISFFAVSNSYGEEKVKSVSIALIVDTTSLLFKCANDYFQTIFKGVPNYKIEIVSLPADRILPTLKSNPNFVGDLGRTKPYSLVHPDYYKILLPIKIGVFCVAKKDSLSSACDIEAIKKSRISVARGNLLVKIFLEKYKLTAELEHKIIPQGLLQLDRNRADVMLIGHDQKLIEKNIAKKYNVHEVVKMEETYTFIKPEYRDLAESLQSEIKRNKKAELRLRRCLRD